MLNCQLVLNESELVSDTTLEQSLKADYNEMIGLDVTLD